VNVSARRTNSTNNSFPDKSAGGIQGEDVNAMRIKPFALVATLALGLPLSSAAVSGQDFELRMKWALAEIVHYDIVGEYSAPVEILSAPGGTGDGKGSGVNRVTVKDRFEVSLDWAPTQVSLVGKPVFKNYPSTVASNLFEGACQQAPPLSGSYDHIEIIDFKVVLAELELSTRRTFPGGSVPVLNEMGRCGLIPVAAKTETVMHRLPILLGTLFATPELAPTNTRVGDAGTSAATKLIVGRDGKTMVLDDSSRGWKYTYTLKIVKEGGGFTRSR